MAFYADTHYRNDGFPEYFTPPRDLDVEAILLGGDNPSRAAVERVKNAVCLDDEVLVLPSGLRVIGSTLRSRVPDEKMAQYRSFLEGYGLKGVDDIRVGDRYLTLEETNLFHDGAVSFIEGELRSLTRAERRETVVCSNPRAGSAVGNVNPEFRETYIVEF